MENLFLGLIAAANVPKGSILDPRLLLIPCAKIKSFDFAKNGLMY